MPKIQGRCSDRCCFHTLLELGGKSPQVVLDEAGIDEAVKAAVSGSFLYQGRKCMSTQRLVKGATLACGGKAAGAIIPATIVDPVKPGMKIYDEETFGPATTVVRVKGLEEALPAANDSAYGLSLAVGGRDATAPLVDLKVKAGPANGSTSGLADMLSGPRPGHPASDKRHYVLKTRKRAVPG